LPLASMKRELLPAARSRPIIVSCELIKVMSS
jgi:hypothetical protein